MKSARNRQGMVIPVEDMMLEQALADDWTCATCPRSVAVYPTKWPCPHCSRDRRDEECVHPHFYWKAHMGDPHLEPCPHVRNVVTATVEERTVRPRYGVPGDGPSAIRFDVPENSAAVADAETVTDQQRTVGRLRTGDGEIRTVEGNATATRIAPACRCFIEHPDDRDRRLAVPGVPEWARRYRTVFKNLARSEGLIGETRIWWAKVRSMRMPEDSGSILSLTFAEERRILIDRTGWGPSATSFDRRLAKVFDEARAAIRRKEAGVWVNLLAFGLGSLDADGSVRVRDPRKVHALVEFVPRRGS
ncbi:hypothetical protein [Sphingomonas sp. Leaf205]|uniref:hypothetical protein n=1 Tax=Sphingomonas sp. Leaf205 TaxID=2876551 RepID=UPI001E509A74|nr:hypothetical protein [Sphingomonas sp. Leaf205]